MKTLIPIGVLFAIIFLSLSSSMALAEKENLTTHDNMTILNGSATKVIIQNMSSTMSVMDAIKARRSIRSYQDRPVEDEKLLEYLKQVG